MKKTLTRMALLLAALAPLAGAVAQQGGHSITVNIKNIPNQTLFLAHHFGNSLYVNDTLVLDASGKGTFADAKPLPGGMYLIYLQPKGTYFDIMLDADQEFSIEVDTANFVETFRVQGSDENQVFYDYQRFLRVRQDKVAALQAEKTTAQEAGNTARVEQIDQQLETLNAEVRDKMIGVTSQHPDLFFSKFLAMTKEVEVPEIKNADGQNDPYAQWIYYRAHYFDNIDLADSRYLRTPVFENKLMNYVKNVLPQIPDTLIVECDKLIEASRPDSVMYRFVLGTLHNHFVASEIMGMDAVFLHLAEKYYVHNWWSNAEYIDDIKERIQKEKPLLIGKTFPNTQALRVDNSYFIQKKSNPSYTRPILDGSYLSMNSVQADYTIVMFWEADCSHCRRALPELKRVYDRLKGHSVEVVAWHMLGGEEGKTKWETFINDNQMHDWVNVWDPTYQSKYKDVYNINSSPVLFLLDKDKKIIGKKIGPDVAEDLIMEYTLRDLTEGVPQAEVLPIVKDFAASFSNRLSIQKAKDFGLKGLQDDQKAEFEAFCDELMSRYPEVEEPESHDDGH